MSIIPITKVTCMLPVKDNRAKPAAHGRQASGRKGATHDLKFSRRQQR